MLARIKPVIPQPVRPWISLSLFSPDRPPKFNRLERHFAKVPPPAFVFAFVKHQSTMSQVTPNLRTSDRELFSYTSGRYLYNEQLRLAERHVEFNIEALRRVTAQSVGRDTVVHMRKLAEGGFNRVLLLTMNDGFEVIVKIPYSIAVPKQLTTESEVATLDFLRSNGIPVPRVYAWSSQAGNEVGCEYIIMEKATGKPLEHRWFNLTAKEQIRLVTSYAEIERKLFAFPFGSYGSIYYKYTLPQNLQGSLYASGTKDDDGDSQRFCIGPIADYMFWRGKRSQLEINRGPCKHRPCLKAKLVL